MKVTQSNDNFIKSEFNDILSDLKIHISTKTLGEIKHNMALCDLMKELFVFWRDTALLTLLTANKLYLTSFILNKIKSVSL